jgi:hypothetical protein
VRLGTLGLVLSHLCLSVLDKAVDSLGGLSSTSSHITQLSSLQKVCVISALVWAIWPKDASRLPKLQME